MFYGAIMLIVGVCQVVWSNTGRQQAELLVEGQEFSRTTGIQREGSADGFQRLTDPCEAAKLLIYGAASGGRIC